MAEEDQYEEERREKGGLARGLPLCAWVVYGTKESSHISRARILKKYFVVSKFVVNSNFVINNY